MLCGCDTADGCFFGGKLGLRCIQVSSKPGNVYACNGLERDIFLIPSTVYMRIIIHCVSLTSVLSLSLILCLKKVFSFAFASSGVLLNRERLRK